MIKAGKGAWAVYRYWNEDRSEGETHNLPIVAWSDAGTPLVAHPETAQLTAANAVTLEDDDLWEFSSIYVGDSSNPIASVVPSHGWTCRMVSENRTLPVIGFVVRETGASDEEGPYMTARARPLLVDGVNIFECANLEYELIPPGEA